MSVHRMKQHDTSPAITATLTSGGVAVDLTGAAVWFLMSDSSGTLQIGTDKPADTDDPDYVANANATITDAAGGGVKYQWVAGDTDTAGKFNGEWEVRFPDATVRTFPDRRFNDIEIFGDLG